MDNPIPADQPVPEGEPIAIPDPVTSKQLASMLRKKPFEIIHDLMELNQFATLETPIYYKAASQVAKKHGFSPRRAI